MSRLALLLCILLAGCGGGTTEPDMSVDPPNCHARPEACK